MSIKVAQNDFSRRIKDFVTFTNLPKNVGDLGILIVAKGFEKLPKLQTNRPIWSDCSEAVLTKGLSFSQSPYFSVLCTPEI